MGMKEGPTEEDPRGKGEVTRGHPRRRDVVARARLRGEAALRCRSGNFRNPRGVRSGHDITRPGSHWPLRPAGGSGLAREAPSLFRGAWAARTPTTRPPGGHPWEQCDRGGVPTPEVTVEKRAAVCPHEYAPRNGLALREPGAQAPTARCVETGLRGPASGRACARAAVRDAAWGVRARAR
ncbi:hypothetical protein VULLAG_LOCUS10153 [Vulpes lagopus]